MPEELTLLQIGVLSVYFIAMYAFKYMVQDTKYGPVLRSFIPALNVIGGLLLGYFGLAGFDVTTGILGGLATGGLAGVVSMPSKTATAAKESSINTYETH